MPIGGIEQTSGVASEAITAWTKYLSQLSAYSVNFEEVKIRGVGIVVEVDETKLGKIKYNRGHLVERVWVIVGVERTSLKKLFCIEVKDRTKETIENVLKTFVEPGSIIYTDGWKPYFNAYPISGVHTNTVEGCNNGIKILLSRETEQKIKLMIIYFIIFGAANIKIIIVWVF